MHQIASDEFLLVSPVSYGCAVLNGVEKLPTYEVVLTNGEGETSLTLWGGAPEPWNDVSLVSIQMYRLPQAEKAFLKTYAWFGNDRKTKARLPERRAVAPTDLAPANLIGAWEHEFLAISGRDLFHIYRTPNIAVLIRFLGRSGTMLDHPLLAATAAGLTLDEFLWTEEMPEMVAVERSTSEEREMDKKELALLEKERKAYRKLLNLPTTASPEAMAERVHQELKMQEVMPLAIAWADALCAKSGWEWVMVDEDFVVASPDRAFMIDPFDVIEKSKKKSTELLLFNMVCGDDLPPASPRAYVSLS